MDVCRAVTCVGFFFLFCYGGDFFVRLSYIYVRGEIGVSLLLMALTVTASSKQACWVFITKKKERKGERAAAVTRQSRCTLKKKGKERTL